MQALKRRVVSSVRNSEWTVHHVNVFVLTFFGYAAFHAARKTFSNVKVLIAEEWTPSNTTCYYDKPCDVNHTCVYNYTCDYRPRQLWYRSHFFENKADASYFLGLMDTIFLSTYAIGLYISGALGDRFDLRRVITTGMCMAAICTFVFGCLTEWLHFYSAPFYVVFWVLNGLFQSVGWPSMVAIIANWFGQSSRGFVLGLWSSCASVGNILGSLMVAEVVDYGYDYAFLLASGLLFCYGIVIFFGLVPSPQEAGLPPPPDDVTQHQHHPAAAQQGIQDDQSDESTPLLKETTLADDKPEQRPKAIGFFQAFCLPGVAIYSISFSCLKLVNYAFFFWLPFYLNSVYGWSQAAADRVSIWYDIGGIIVGTICGFITDRMTHRSPVVVIMVLLGAPALYGYSKSPNDMVINSILMFVAGAFIGGASNIISSAIAADIGKNKAVAGNREALSTVTGIVDGTGSAGAAVGQILIPLIQNRVGWQFVFYLFIVLTLLSFLCLLPILVRDLRRTPYVVAMVTRVSRRRASVQTGGGILRD